MSSSSTSSSSESSSSSSSSSYWFSTSSSSSSSSSELFSSESEGNISSSSSSFGFSSSSSSLEIWNIGKPLVLAHSAIDGISINNRLAQTLKLTDDSYYISKVYCYLMGIYGENNGFVINLGIYLCNNEGEPSSLVQLATIDAETIKTDGWYAFNFDIDIETPLNQYLSFVMWQEGGDEDNYIMWAYGSDLNENDLSPSLHKSWISDDGLTWVYEPGITRSLRIIGDFDPFNLIDAQVETEPAKSKEIQLYFNERNTFYNITKLNEDDSLVLEYPPIALSFVIDNSGSMGWNDRFENRRQVMAEMISEIQSKYPNDFIFDFVTFGAKVANTSSVNSNLGEAMSINLDANNPSRATYLFNAVSNVTTVSGNEYGHNGHTYIISRNGNSVKEVYCSGTGIPLNSGTLIKIGGTESENIVFDSYSSINFSDKMVAFGFKNLEDGHQYVIGNIKVDDTVISSTAIDNYHLYYPVEESPSIGIGNNGPNGDSSVDLGATASVVLRKRLTDSFVTSVNMLSDAITGIGQVYVDDIRLFNVDNFIDLVDGDKTVVRRTIVNIDSTNNILYFSPSLQIDINNNNSTVEEYGERYSKTFDGTTIRLLVKDELVSRHIVFFLQNVNGFTMEWDFTPHVDWIFNNLFYLDQTAQFPISTFDENDEPFGDGTMVVLEVDKKENLKDILEIDREPTKLTETAPVGATRIEVVSLEGYIIGMTVDIVGRVPSGASIKNATQTVTVTETGAEGSKFYIKFLEPLLYEFNPAYNGRVLPNEQVKKELTDNSSISVSLPIVDVTPVEMGESLNPSLLKPYDSKQVQPPLDPEDEEEIMTIYDSLNYDRDVIKRGKIDSPTIGGRTYTRVLPITEDILIPVVDKDRFSEALLRGEPQWVYTEQTERQSGDIDSLEIPSLKTDEGQKIGEDYIIDTPVFLRGGSAVSNMTTTANPTDYVAYKGYSIPGVPLPVELKTKNYKIFPHIREESQTGVITGIQYFDEFEVNFVNPIKIYSSLEEFGMVDFWCEKTSLISEEGLDVPSGYEKKQVYGVIAEETPGSINYVVANRGILVKSGELKIKLYSNTIKNQEEFTCLWDEEPKAIQTEEYINRKPSKKIEGIDGEEVEVEVLSEIDQWRNVVQANPVSKLAVKEFRNESDMTALVRERIDLSKRNEYLALIGEGEAGFAGDPGVGVQGAFDNYNFYGIDSAAEWTVANQYDVYELSIPIVNGKATFNLPSSEIEALIFVEASYEIKNTVYEAINASLVFIRNPLMIGGLSPYKTKPNGDPSIRYELSGEVTWVDGFYGTIEDNTLVNYKLFSPASPTVSSTDNGWAGGVFIGPKDRIMLPPDDQNSEISPPLKPEVITVTITHSSGWINTLKRNIYWEPEKETRPKDDFDFQVQTATIQWSDGFSGSSVTSDINSTTNRSVGWAGDIGSDALQGWNQPNGEARSVYHFDSAAKPYQLSWGDYGGKVEFFHDGQNISIGNQPRATYRADSKPYATKLNLTTFYTLPGELTQFGSGWSKIEYGIEIVKTPPYFRYKEPLSIEMEYENEYHRDGLTQSAIVVSVYWKGVPITDRFIINENGDSIYFPRPWVRFLAGEPAIVQDGASTTQAINESKGGPDTPPDYYDCRGRYACLLDIEKNREVNLSSYNLQTSLSRTDRYMDKSDPKRLHTHSCTVDGNGNGITTSTTTLPYIKDAESSEDELSEIIVNDHVHVIENYIAKESAYDLEIHTHKLRSVAVTTLLPTTSKKINIGVIGIAEYDPTFADPYPLQPFGVGKRYPMNGNRMMFDSVTFLGSDASISSPKLVLDLSTDSPPLDPTKSSTYYSSEFLHETEKGFNISAHAYFTSYTRDDGEGGFEQVPARNVDDGSRIITSIRVFSPTTSLDGLRPNYAIVSGPDIVKNYMILVIRASISTEGEYASQELQVAVDSNLSWLPDYKALTLDPTTDPIYISDAVGYIRTIGGSALYDAMRLAAQRIIYHQQIHPEISNYKTAVILLTDGDENSSQYSLDQAIRSIGFIENGKTPIIPVNLGEVYRADQIVLTKMYTDTYGFQTSSFDVDSVDIPFLVDSMFTHRNWIVGRGTYRNIAALNVPGLPDKLFLSDVFTPDGSDVEFRYRTSVDGLEWNLWSQWLRHTEQHSVAEILNSITLYIEYEFKLIGNSDFNTPFVNEDMTIRHFQPSDFAMFFNPLDIGGGDANAKNNQNYYTEEGRRFLSSIHITHEADIPESSTIEYGITQSDSEDIDAFYSMINPDQQTIILTRYNEPMVTTNNKIYKALNGAWPDKVKISIYRINEQYPNGILVNPSAYSPNNIEGIVSFYNGQQKDDRFVICVEVYPSFRLVCKVVNYGSKSAIIHHIGIVYNMMKRIPTDNNGTIINTPINSRIS